MKGPDTQADDPLRLLLEVFALQADVLYRYMERIYDEAYLETGGGPGELRPSAGYLVRVLDDGAVTVAFGEGRRGRRPPPGRGRIVATYRHGSGSLTLDR
jgi:hypothetical protein